MDQSQVLEQPDGPPECSLRAARELCYLRLLGVDIAVVSPETEEPENDLTLTYGQPQGAGQTFSDQVILLEEEAG
ncbi:hypothetical protein ES708_01461 [subsurface metagenome]